MSRPDAWTAISPAERAVRQREALARYKRANAGTEAVMDALQDKVHRCQRCGEWRYGAQPCSLPATQPSFS